MENEKDVKSYLALLSLIPSYFDSLAAYETDKAAAGMFMASEDASMVIPNVILWHLRKEKPFLQTVFCKT